jgi:hypothetical protein
VGNPRNMINATVRESVADLAEGYDGEGEVDLHAFAGSLAAYAATVATVVLAARAGGHRLPEAYPVRDLVVGGVAVHKFTRLVSKSSVASPLRAPFTEFEAATGSGEHQEQARGSSGVRHAIGELVTCPFCLGVWVGTAYVGALVVSPRWARTWAALFSVSGVSDALQQGYARLQR